ncbi:MAG: alpha-glucuronidase [Chloroflexi bacterium]|nr:alpha-glucuronidase [Chloroflexota bacterium]
MHMPSPLPNEDGYDLWLRYRLIADPDRLAEYRAAIQQIFFPATTPTLIAARDELLCGLSGLLGQPISLTNHANTPGTLTFWSAEHLPPPKTDRWQPPIGAEGYLITRFEGVIQTLANHDIGILYGIFAFLRHLQMHQPLDFPLTSAPKIQHRILNHWDNLDGTIERGYAGHSLWDWHKLPDYLSPRYIDYARACVSVGINGTVLTNVNANALILTPQYLEKVAALANVFRPYGLRVYLTARFSAPIEIGNLPTADPLDPAVIAWWNAKADEIYALIPDFGGFVVKANSEGQPGPGDYGRTQADGANLLANALAPHGGLCIWRAFVYTHEDAEDRHKQAYNELVPLDGQFAPNALLQVKNGAIDFMPREPYHPIFGAMPKTPLMLEVQITQEYLGQGTHLAYLAPMYKEVLDADTGCAGAGSTVARVIDGSLAYNSSDAGTIPNVPFLSSPLPEFGEGSGVGSLSGMAGVANIGDDRNWCGHPFAAANWYAFGRLAWDHDLTSEQIADEWLRLTFTNNADFIEQAKWIMMQSREAVVDYMTPLGLAHLMEAHHHYGPAPWIDYGRADWQSIYYHCADTQGIGCNRTSTGTNAISQYCPPFRDLVADINTCPENLLLWFHHVRWDYPMQSGRTLWDELCFHYTSGLQSVRTMQVVWDALAQYVDAARFEHVRALLRIQEKDARWWRDACLLYFQTFSGLPIPDHYQKPEHPLEYYKAIKHYYVPGIPEQRDKR